MQIPSIKIVLCLILRKDSVSINNYSYEEWFYRIDFLTGNGKDETKQFFDILRNRHYVVTVTKMKVRRDMPRMMEALDNPSSNIEYSIDGSAEEICRFKRTIWFGFYAGVECFRIL